MYQTNPQAQTDLSIPRGEVSQSFQIAPFDDYYQFANTSADVEQYDLSLAHWNTYKGGTFQQAVSTLMYIDNDNYQGTSGGFGVYGVSCISLEYVQSLTKQASRCGPTRRTETMATSLGWLAVKSLGPCTPVLLDPTRESALDSD